MHRPVFPANTFSTDCDCSNIWYVRSCADEGWDWICGYWDSYGHRHGMYSPNMEKRRRVSQGLRIGCTPPETARSESRIQKSLQVLHSSDTQRWRLLSTLQSLHTGMLLNYSRKNGYTVTTLIWSNFQSGYHKSWRIFNSVQTSL